MNSTRSIDSLALETIQAIFTYLSQSDLARCACVNRGWCLATRDLMYSSIQIYNLSQIQRLIHASQPPLPSVHRITLHCHVQDTETWTQLQAKCPNVKQVSIMPDQHPGLYGVCCHRRRYPLAQGWPLLVDLPVWHKDPPTLWIPLLASQLTSLAMDLYFYDTFELPLVPHLTRLELYASRGLFRFDERSFTTIHAACPLLQSLDLFSFQLDLGSSSFTSSSLQRLGLDHVCLVDATGYTWLGQTYPELQTLRLANVRVTAPEENPDALLVRLITHQCPRLTRLEIEQQDTRLLSGLNPSLKNLSLDHLHWTVSTTKKGLDVDLFVYLTSLALTTSDWMVTTATLPRLECLKLEFTTPTRLDFTHLIAMCPNLTRLDTSNATLFTSSVPTSVNKLTHWTYTDTTLTFDSTIATICASSPRLAYLTLRHLRCHLDTVPAKEAGQRFVLGLNLGKLVLVHLDVSNLWYESMMMADPRFTKRVAVQQIHVHQQTRTQSCCEDRIGDLWENKVQVHITCHSIDRIRLSRFKYC